MTQLRRGFTIVELVVVMVIMAVLLTLGVVAMGSVQRDARDRERQADVEQIARGLEQRYVRGNPAIIRTGVNGSGTDVNTAVAGGYPSVLEFFHIAGFDLTTNNYNPVQVQGGYREKDLPGTTKDSFTAPGQAVYAAINIYCFYCNSGSGVPPENATYLATLVTKDVYIYEPLNASGQQCNDEVCARFNLYYRKEADSTFTVIRSKHQ